MLSKDTTLYIAGTDWTDPRDIDANARTYIGDIKTSYKYQDALNHVLRYPQIKTVVGFSLGGSIANELANQKSISSVRMYNSPHITKDSGDKKTIFYHENDPIYGIFKKEISPDSAVILGTSYGHTMEGHQYIF